MVTIDFLSKKDLKKFNHTDETSFIKPERLPEEIITNSIVTKAIQATKDSIINPEVVGILRWNEAPNAEKDITIVKDTKE